MMDKSVTNGKLFDTLYANQKGEVKENNLIVKATIGKEIKTVLKVVIKEVNDYLKSPLCSDWEIVEKDGTTKTFTNYNSSTENVSIKKKPYQEAVHLLNYETLLNIATLTTDHLQAFDSSLPPEISNLLNYLFLEDITFSFDFEKMIIKEYEQKYQEQKEKVPFTQ